MVTKDHDIKQQLRVQWNKICDSGHWPTIDKEQLKMELWIGQEDIQNMTGHISEWEVNRAIGQLRNGMSSGMTDIPLEMIKHLLYASRIILLEWMRNVWDTADMPKENDRAKSIFLHKKGDTHTLDNYSTITTGCNLCKVYNRVLTNRLQDAMENSNVFGEVQNGFPKGRRATDSLLVMETIK